MRCFRVLQRLKLEKIPVNTHRVYEVLDNIKQDKSLLLSLLVH